VLSTAGRGVKAAPAGGLRPALTTLPIFLATSAAIGENEVTVSSQTRQPTAAAGPIPDQSAPTRLRPEANTVRGNSLRMPRHAVPTRELQSGGSPNHAGLTRLEDHGERAPPHHHDHGANSATVIPITSETL
jgi:hypothetical protein